MIENYYERIYIEEMAEVWIAWQCRSEEQPSTTAMPDFFDVGVVGVGAKRNQSLPADS